MRPETSDRKLVADYVEALRGHLDSPRLAAAAAAHPDGAAGLMGELPAPADASASSGGGDGGVPYFSREPAVSVLQSVLDAALADLDGSWWRRLVLRLRRLLHPGAYTSRDPEWVIGIGEAVLGHLARGNHPFNPVPALHQISDTARVVVVGDWGTGLPRARAVGALMAAAVTDAMSDGRQAHVIHLGDIYYSGLPREDLEHVLDPWPVTVEQARAGATSWSLNGNHDMYSGGYGYFGTLLADPRFAAQHSPDGRPTSLFRLSSPSWELLGLDTSWDPDVLARGRVGRLHDPQAALVQDVAAASDRRLALFSHHQLVSVYDTSDLGPELAQRLAPVLDTGRVTAWWWGHEHRAMGYAPTGGVAFPRCLGNGGVPIRPHDPDSPIPAPGSWEARTSVVEDGERWARFGFAVLDLDGPTMTVRYVDDSGATVHTETVT